MGTELLAHEPTIGGKAISISEHWYNQIIIVSQELGEVANVKE
jgi:hypothetical protein